VAFVLVMIFDLFAWVDRILQRRPETQIDQDIWLMYNEPERERHDPTVPPVVDYAATRNARQRR